MAKKADIIKAWENIPPAEKAALKRFLKGDVREAGPYGFTSRNIMVRSSRVNLWGLDEPITRAALERAVPLT